MPVLKLYPNGLTGGMPPANRVDRQPVSRGECKGWTLKSSRGNTLFLYSVVADELPVTRDGKPLVGLAASFTVRKLPASHEDWKALRDNLIKRLWRKGLCRIHWLTEWQQRGVPHLHFAAWFDLEAVQALAVKWGYPKKVADQILACLIKSDWLILSNSYHSSGLGQDIKPITDEVGWLQYLSKHAARGAGHYQRSLQTIPKEWVTSGRMWGYQGDFPTCEPEKIDTLNKQMWFEFRRIVRSWRIAQARAEKKLDVRRRRIRSARRMLLSSNPELGQVRGVSEWIPKELGEQILEFVLGPCLSVPAD